MDINHVVLVGRLTRDAEYKVVPSGQALCNFAIAVNRFKKAGDQYVEEANFFDVVLWGRQAETLNRYLLKGKQVGIEGELRQERWQQPDGQNRSKVRIVANNVQLLGGGQSASTGYGDTSTGGYGNAPVGGGYSVPAGNYPPAPPAPPRPAPAQTPPFQQPPNQDARNFPGGDDIPF
jgi:single-strand DNA-binding protein